MRPWLILASLLGIPLMHELHKHPRLSKNKMYRWCLELLQSRFGQTACLDRRWLKDVRRHVTPTEHQVIFDIGAHVGSVSAKLAQRFPHATIHAFEPIGSSFEILQRAARRFLQVVPHHMAISNADGMARMRSKTTSQTNHIIDHDGPISTADQLEEVPTRSIDSVAAELGISTVSFCKIDTEGHELRVLDGASTLLRSAAIDLLLIESTCNLRGAPHVDFVEIIAHMRSYSYQIIDIYNYGIGRFVRGSAYCNALFARRS